MYIYDELFILSLKTVNVSHICHKVIVDDILNEYTCFNCIVYLSFMHFWLFLAACTGCVSKSWTV